MSRIHITREHEAGRAQAREAADQIAAEMADRFGVKARWEDDVLQFNHSGVKGQITVEEDRIEIEARLGLLVAPLKKPLENAIHRYIDDYLA